MGASNGKGVEKGKGAAARAGHGVGVSASVLGPARGDLFSRAVTLLRVLRALGLRERSVLRVHVGVDRTGLQHVDGDAARTEVARCALRVADNRSLGGGVVGHAGKRGASGAARTDGDD